MGNDLKQPTIPTSAQRENRRTVGPEEGQALLLQWAYFGNVEMVEKYLKDGAPLDTLDKVTGMTALHLAVGSDHLNVARLLVERGASFLPDNQGRMPTTIAAECEVSEELCDFIVEAEAAAAARDEGV